MTFRRHSRARSAASSCASASAKASPRASRARVAALGRITALAFITAAVVVGCGAGGGKPTTQSDLSPAIDPGCSRAPGHHEIAGELVNVPRGLADRPPLLIALHGLRQSATSLAGQTDFDDIGAKHGFVTAYPHALEGQRWQLSGGDRDVRRLSAFIDKVVKDVCADPRRVYLTGFSMGGSFAYRAGCDLADKVAAIAPVSGSYRSQAPCPAGTRPMPTLEIHGRDPWTNTVPRLIAATRERNHCKQRPRTHHMAPGVNRILWPGCGLQRIDNRYIGHEWLKLGDYNTGEEVWRFVSRYRLP